MSFITTAFCAGNSRDKITQKKKQIKRIQGYELAEIHYYSHINVALFILHILRTYIHWTFMVIVSKNVSHRFSNFTIVSGCYRFRNMKKCYHHQTEHRIWELCVYNSAWLIFSMISLLHCLNMKCLHLNLVPHWS